jgi:molybdenum cofactor guanylyltransferase
MTHSIKVSGLVLAGGRAERMQQRDKGLLMLNGKTLLEHSLNALRPLTDELMISANRNLAQYAAFGYPVLSDAQTDYPGPLAGILSGLQHAQYPLLLVVPCDVPLIGADVLQRLLDALLQYDCEIAVAAENEFLHPTLLAMRATLAHRLQQSLQLGTRRLRSWLELHDWRTVDCSDCAAQLLNINTPQQLAQLQQDLD